MSENPTHRVQCPDCLGQGCLHCRERQLARAELNGPSRTSLTNPERRALGLVVRLRFDDAPPVKPVQGCHRMTPVLPASFTLPTMNL